MLAYWWVIPTILWYVTMALVTVQTNTKDEWYWPFLLFALNVCPLWTLVALKSKDLLFDGMLYDNIILLSFVCVMMYFGQMKGFSAYQWIGLICVIIGFVLMKVSK